MPVRYPTLSTLGIRGFRAGTCERKETARCRRRTKWFSLASWVLNFSFPRSCETRPHNASARVGPQLGEERKKPCHECLRLKNKNSLQSPCSMGQQVFVQQQRAFKRVRSEFSCQISRPTVALPRKQ